MKKIDLKKATAKLGERVAQDSVGKSIPRFFYEPKVPASLKEKK